MNSYHIYPDLALDSGCAFFKSNLFKNPEYVTVSSTELPPIVSVRTVTWIPSSLPACGVTYLEVWQNKLFCFVFWSQTVFRYFSDCQSLFCRGRVRKNLRQEELLGTDSRLWVTASVCSVNAKAPWMSFIRTALESSKIVFHIKKLFYCMIDDSITYKRFSSSLSTRFLWRRKWRPWGRYEQVLGWQSQSHEVWQLLLRLLIWDALRKLARHDQSPERGNVWPITMVPCYPSPLGTAVTSLGTEGRVVTTWKCELIANLSSRSTACCPHCLSPLRKATLSYWQV